MEQKIIGYIHLLIQTISTNQNDKQISANISLGQTAKVDTSIKKSGSTWNQVYLIQVPQDPPRLTIVCKSGQEVIGECRYDVNPFVKHQGLAHAIESDLYNNENQSQGHIQLKLTYYSAEHGKLKLRIFHMSLLPPFVERFKTAKVKVKLGIHMQTTPEQSLQQQFDHTVELVLLMPTMNLSFEVANDEEQKIPELPGPGQYNPQTGPKVIKPSDPKYSFGKDGRKQIATYVPGPGAYQVKQGYTVDVQHFIKTKKNPSFSMLSRRQLKQSKMQVGPGQYQPKYSFAKQKSPAYSTLENKPGPGQYESITEFHKKGGNSFGRDSKIRQQNPKVPGPGSYDYETAAFKYGSKQQPAYGFGSRIQMKNSNYIPGPGQYEPKKQIYSKIGGIMARDMSSSMILSKTPGPGSYDDSGYQKVKGKDPMWSLSKSSRDNMFKNNSVGPGQYESDKPYRSVINSPPAYGFGSDKRDFVSRTDAPGPGSYDQSLMKSRMSIKIGQKPKQLSMSYVPGPGSYESDKYNKDAWLKGQGRYSVGKSHRDSLSSSFVPGPGAYDNSHVKLSQPKGKVTFGRDSRIKYDSSKTPGPGSYSLKPTFADVPKYLLPNQN